MPNEFVRDYDDSYGFRQLVLSKIRSGEITGETVEAIVALPDLDGDTPEAAKARALRAEYSGQ